MLKQQQLSVVPCLDVNPYISFKRENKNNVFRFWVEMGDRIYNDGYHCKSSIYRDGRGSNRHPRAIFLKSVIQLQLPACP